MDSDDVAKTFASMYNEGGERYKYLETPMSSTRRASSMWSSATASASAS